MADISTELQAIMDAVYGEEVRGSIHDAIEKINEVSETSAEEAFDALETANQANATANDANIYARSANNNANAADTKATNAETTVLVISNTKVNWPRNERDYVTYGENGQLLVTNGDGTTRWDDGLDPEAIEDAVDTYLDEHGVETTFDIEDDNQGNVEFVGSNTEIGQLKENVQRLVSDVPVTGQEGNVLTWHAYGNSFDAQGINAHVTNDGHGNVTIDGEVGELLADVVSDGEGRVELVGVGIDERIEPVNVLTLGVKNDGSVDCSSIINSATQNHSLYFPAGIYRIDNELRLVHSIHGAGYNRRFNIDPTFTVFKSNIANATSSTAVIRVVGKGSGSNLLRGIEIDNIDIKLSGGDESGIIIQTSDKEALSIHHVGIKDIGNAYGIWCCPTVTTSRLVFIDNCTLYGSYRYVNSTGILIDRNALDSRITNTEILGVKKGIWQKVNLLYIANLHIWTGCRSEEDTDDWWSTTVGIDCSTDIIESVILNGTNVYIDSSHHYIEAWRGASINLTNVLVWMDGSMEGSSSYDGQFVYVRGDSLEKNIFINGLSGFFGERTETIMTNTVSFRNVKLIISENDDLVSDADAKRFPVTSYIEDKEFSFSDYGGANTYIEIARAVLRPQNKISFEFSSTGNDIISFYLSTDSIGNLKILKQQDGGTADYFFSYNQANNIVIVYRKKYSSDVMHGKIKVLSATYSAGLLNYSSIRVFGRKTLDSEATLSKITAKKSGECIIIDDVSNFSNTLSMLDVRKTYMVYLTEPVTSMITNSKVSSIFKGNLFIIASDAVDFIGGSGGDLYMIRTDINGVIKISQKATMTAI